MQLKKIVPTSLFPLVCLGSLMAAAPQPRTDINPALLYWQALSIFPEETEDTGKAFHFEGWPKGKLGPKDVAVARRFDPMFKLIRRAARMNAPCDWGFDFSDGPEMVMPNLVQLRKATHATALRARVALDEGRQDDARKDIVAMFALARRSAVDGALVQIMIQVAIESSLLEFIADQFDRFSTETLQQLVADLAAAPPKVTTATAMANERQIFYEWLVAKAEGFREANPDDEAESLESTRRLINELFSPEEAEMRQIMDAANGTMTGMLAYIKQLSPLYEEMIKLASSSPSKLAEQTTLFETFRKENPNHLASMLIPNLAKARKNELKHDCQLVMLRAAAAYRAHGTAGLNAVQDPFGKGPFQFNSVDLEDGRKGFELSSELITLHEGARQVFIE